MKRKAFTLVEMVAVIAVSSAIMGVGIVMLAALLKNESSSRKHLEFCKNMNRLDEQFRADVHAAASASRTEGGALQLQLPAPNKTLIRYSCESQEITREEIELEDNKTLRRESYALPEEVTSSMEQKSEGTKTSLILRVEPKPTPGTKIRYPTASIEATLAKDLRFQKANKQE
jgi:type II secretory pathway component PulJ